MQDIFSILNTATPFGVIGLLVFIVYKLVVGEDILGKIRGTQKEKYPALEDHYGFIKDKMDEIQLVFEEQKKFRENHSMHEIPAIVEKLDRQQVDFARLETKVDKITDVQITQGLVIERLKTLSERN